MSSGGVSSVALYDSLFTEGDGPSGGENQVMCQFNYRLSRDCIAINKSLLYILRNLAPILTFYELKPHNFFKDQFYKTQNDRLEICGLSKLCTRVLRV